MKRKKTSLEKFDKKTGKWETVPLDAANEEMLRIYEIMEAELEITAKEEAMKLGLYEIKNKD
jgi:hypothetical protein